MTIKTFTRTAAITLALASTAGLSACSSGSSNTSSSVKSTPSQSQSNGNTQASQSASSQSASSQSPAWLVNGKVDVTKVQPSDVSAVCDRLFGSADKLARRFTVDTLGKSSANASGMNWAENPWTQDGNGTSIECSPVGGSNNLGGSYHITIGRSKSYNGTQGPYKKNAVFGYGPKALAKVNDIFVMSNMDQLDPKVKTLTTDEGLDEASFPRFIDNADGTTTKMSRDEYIAYIKKNNAAVLAVTQPIVDEAAKHIYGG